MPDWSPVLSAHCLALQGQKRKLQAICDGEPIEQTTVVFGRLVTFTAPAPMSDRLMAFKLMAQLGLGGDEGSADA